MTEPLRVVNEKSPPRRAKASSQIESPQADGQGWYVYLLLCRGGRIYTGATPDLAKRMQKHRDGTGARFTRSNPPENLLGARLFPSKSAALSMEYQIKQLTAIQKRTLASTWSHDCAIETQPGAVTTTSQP